MTIGFIGVGLIGRALAEKSVRAGYQVVVSNKRGPDSLASYVRELGPLASAGTVAAAAAADVVFLAVRWPHLEEALHGLPDWQGRIVVDTNNPISPDGTYAELGNKTSSEVVAALVPGARVVKAFNSLLSAWIGDEPRQPAGKRVVFMSGDDAGAKNTVKSLIAAFGFAPVDLGSLAEGGKMQQAGHPLALLNLLLTN
ncbi:NADPH-dependent F420 reductase [Hymenobacter terricola]|uniref:NADPH-dependent F420 reductase n=1 Tax=Hymenobacter terricola TaxID=2819236 RepID=UPI001B30C953|nr:NAD(P)-binding domain-containing protein [Hymenobacter terricola]